MDLSASHYIQLILAISLVAIGFVLAYLGPEKPVVQILVLMIPFQFVMSRYGSINTGLALLVFVAFLLNGRIRKLPMLPWFGLVCFVYLITFTQVHKTTYADHMFYLIAVAANIAMFYIVFNSTLRAGNAHKLFSTLLWLNVLVDMYCYAQLLLGFESLALFGVSELSLQQNRADARLSGPFNAVGITAEYLVIQTYILLYMLFHEIKRNKKIFILSVMTANFAFLIATGNRGGILVLIFGAIIFFLLFRKEFGGAKIFYRSFIGAALFGVMAFFIVSFTQFNVLFDRLSQTEVKEGLPDTRAVIWPLAWERIQEKPIIGHGPRIRLIEEEVRRIPGHQFMPYPHSTYLFIFYTIGIIGLVVYGIIYFVFLAGFIKGIHNPSEDAFLKGIPKLALLLLIIVAIDQLKVSFLRFGLADYQQYISALFGGLLAGTVLASERRSNTGASDSEYKNKRILSVAKNEGD